MDRASRTVDLSATRTQTRRARVLAEIECGDAFVGYIRQRRLSCELDRLDAALEIERERLRTETSVVLMPGTASACWLKRAPTGGPVSPGAQLLVLMQARIDARRRVLGSQR